MAHNAAIQGVSYDSVELFRGDPLYAIHLKMVVDEVASTNRAAEERERRAQAAGG